MNLVALVGRKLNPKVSRSLEECGIFIREDSYAPQRLPRWYREVYGRDHSFQIFSIYRLENYIGLLAISLHENSYGKDYEVRMFRAGKVQVTEQEIRRIMNFIIGELWPTQSPKVHVSVVLESLIVFPTEVETNQLHRLWGKKVNEWEKFLKPHGFKRFFESRGASDLMESLSVTFRRKGPFPNKRKWFFW